MKYEIFHSGYWEKELFLAPCQPRRTIPLLGFPAGRWYSPHTRVRLVLSRSSQQYVRGTEPASGAPSLSSLGSCTLSSKLQPLWFPHVLSSIASSHETIGLCWASRPCPRSWNLPADRELGNCMAASSLPFSHRSLSFIVLCPCLERCCFICKLGFRCFR